MRRRSLVALILVAVLTGAACGSSSKAGSTSTTLKLSSPSWETAKPYPSKSAKMICQTEVRGEIAARLRVTETRVVPTWSRKRHLYSCAYVYPHGRKILLSVKELSNERETTAYFHAIRKQYGDAQELFGLGQGAWALENDDIVVRKDYKVLLVDVRSLPKGAGAFAPGFIRPDVANNIAALIMVCWTGA